MHHCQDLRIAELPPRVRNHHTLLFKLDGKLDGELDGGASAEYLAEHGLSLEPQGGSYYRLHSRRAVAARTLHAVAGHLQLQASSSPGQDTARSRVLHLLGEKQPAEVEGGGHLRLRPVFPPPPWRKCLAELAQAPRGAPHRLVVFAGVAYWSVRYGRNLFRAVPKKEPEESASHALAEELVKGFASLDVDSAHLPALFERLTDDALALMACSGRNDMTLLASQDLIRWRFKALKKWRHYERAKTRQDAKMLRRVFNAATRSGTLHLTPGCSAPDGYRAACAMAPPGTWQAREHRCLQVLRTACERRLRRACDDERAWATELGVGDKLWPVALSCLQRLCADLPKDERVAVQMSQIASFLTTNQAALIQLALLEEVSAERLAALRAEIREASHAAERKRVAVVYADSEVADGEWEHEALPLGEQNDPCPGCGSATTRASQIKVAASDEAKLGVLFCRACRRLCTWTKDGWV